MAGFGKRRPELLALAGPGTQCSAQGLVQSTSLERGGRVPQGWRKEAETGRRRSQVASRAGTAEGQSWRQSVAISSLSGWNQTVPSLGLSENGYGILTDGSWEKSGVWGNQNEKRGGTLGAVGQCSSLVTLYKLEHLKEGLALRVGQNGSGLMMVMLTEVLGSISPTL